MKYPLSHRLRSFLTTTAMSVIWVLPAGLAQANPLDGVVVGGSASIVTGDKSVDVTQQSDRAVIDWRSFNIGLDEQTRFYQPNSNSIIINRVKDANPSEILGRLQANGDVVLINPNGVLFGQNAVVDVNGLVATTADIDNDAFMSGSNHFDKAGNTDASIINNGQISAKDAGLVGLVAPNVINNGVINAKLGRVELASGDTMTVDFMGNGLTEIAVSDAVQTQLVRNTGKINAAGGVIAVTAAAGKNIVNNLIDIKGELKAPSVSQHNGRIIISALSHNKQHHVAKVNIQAKLDVSGKGHDEKGGNIQISGDEINVASGSLLDVSGDSGGGEIKIGGDYQGQGNMPTAFKTTIESGASILNNAITLGNGGRTIIWSDDTTTFAGDIEGKGGALGGNGGFVETSGKNNLLVTGNVNLRADNGSKGDWLLDPANITIYNHSNGSTDNVNSFTTSYLEAQSASSNITLSATNDITFNMGYDTMDLASGSNLTVTAGHDILATSDGTINTYGSGSVLFSAGNDISLAQQLNIEAKGTGTITFQANNTIAELNGLSLTTHGSNIVVNSDRDASGYGAIYFQYGAYVYSNGGDIVFGGGTNPLTGFAKGELNNYHDGVTLSVTNINAGTGNITVNGEGGGLADCNNDCTGLAISNVNLNTIGSGKITLNGRSGGDINTYSVIGIQLYNNSINTVNGDIFVNGSTPSGRGNSDAISFGNGDFATTGTGSVFFNVNNTPSTSDGIVSYGTIHSNNSISIASDNISGNLHYTAANNLIIRPVTNGRTMGIGSGTGDFQITDNFFNDLTYGSLWLGGYGNFGDVDYINTAGDINVGGNRTLSGNLNLVSQGVVTVGDSIITMATNKNFSILALGNLISSGTSAVQTAGTGNINLKSIYGGIFYGAPINFNATGTGNITVDAQNNNMIFSSLTGITLQTNAGNITVNSNSFSFNNPVTLLSISGNITLNANIILNSGNTTINSGLGKLSTKAINANSYNLELVAADMDLGGSISGTGNLIINASSPSRVINLNSGVSDGTNFNLSLSDLENIGSNWASVTIGSNTQNAAINAGSITWNGGVTLLSNNGNINLNGMQTMNSNKFLARTTGTGDIIIGSTGGVTSTSSGDAVVLASNHNFINYNASTSVLSANNGRWLVYSTSLDQNIRGNLMPNASAVFNANYGSNAPASVAAGNHFIFSASSGPTLTVTADNQTKTYGSANGALTYNVTGFVDADTIVSALTGAASVSTAINSTSAAGTYTGSLISAQGTLASNLGYQFSFVNGNYTVDKANLTVTANNATKNMGQTLSFTGSEFMVSGLLNSDTVTHAALTSAGAASGASAGNYNIIASNATGSGLSNYNISYVNGTMSVVAISLPPAPPVVVSPPAQIPKTVDYASQIPVMTVDVFKNVVTYTNSRSGFSKIITDAGMQQTADIKPVKMLGTLVEIDPSLSKEFHL